MDPHPGAPWLCTQARLPNWESHHEESVHPQDTGLGGGAQDQHPFDSRPLGSRGRVEESCARGPGTEIQLPSGEGGSAWEGAPGSGGLRPPPPPEGKERRRPARSKQTRRGGQRGGGGRPGIGQHRAGQSWLCSQRDHVQFPPRAPTPPPRAAFSIHKFPPPATAATGRWSQPGAATACPPPMGRAPRR